MAGTTGDIKWTWTDPKTVELTNTPPDDFGRAAVAASAGFTPDQIRGMTSHYLSQEEIAKAMGGEPPTGPLQVDLKGSREALRINRRQNRTREARQDRAKWREQLRGFSDYVKGGGLNLRGGVQELVESGALTVGEDGKVRLSMPYRGDMDQLMNAVGLWNDFQNDLAAEMLKRPNMTNEERAKLFYDMLREREPGT